MTNPFETHQWDDGSFIQDQIAQDMVTDRYRRHAATIRAYLEVFDPEKLPLFDLSMEHYLKARADAAMKLWGKGTTDSTVFTWHEDGEIKSRIIAPEEVYTPPQKAT